MDWDGFVAQVRERYLQGRISLEEYERDLLAAVLLDEGLYREGLEIPPYLVDRWGFPIVGA